MGVLKPALALVLLTACVPEIDSDESTVLAPRVLAITAEPAEVTPGASSSVRYRALIADGNGVRADIPVTWFQCLAQKPLAELGPISPECLNTDSGKLMQIGAGQDIQSTVPSDACSLFGPNPPLPMGMESPGRPVDPDTTGGYKLPVIAAVPVDQGTAVTLFEQRIYCGLTSVSQDVSVDFAQRYHANANPWIIDLRYARASGTGVLAPEEPLVVAPGETVQLQVVWPVCPTTDVCGDGVCGPDESATTCAAECQPLRGCGGQERYLQYDRRTFELVVQRETFRVAWYTTAGTYDDERTGVDAENQNDGSGNTFHAPRTPGSGFLWMVVRDSRGGIGYRAQPLIVR